MQALLAVYRNLEVPDQIGWLQRKAHPSALKADPAVAWAVEEVVPQHGADVVEDLRGTCWMQSVASIVHAQAIQIEATGVSSNAIGSLDNRDLEEITTPQLCRGADAGRTGA